VLDTNDDGEVTDQEIQNAVQILEKAKRNKEKANTRKQFTLYGNYMMESANSYK